MEITLETFSEDGDLFHLESVDWPKVPRKKETVVLYGKKYGKAKENDRSFFTVVNVVWEMNGDKKLSVSVHLELAHWDEGRVYFRPKCVCDSSEEEEENPGVCTYCGDRLP